jgi:hypothetical protein
LDPEDYEVLLSVANLALYTQFGFTIKIKPMAWREFLSGRGTGRRKADNQPEWTKGTRGVQQEAMAQQESEALVYGRRRHDERQRDNQLHKCHERGTMRGGGAMRGRGAGIQEAAA